MGKYVARGFQPTHHTRASRLMDGGVGNIRVPRHGCAKRTVRGGHILFLDPHVKAYCQGTPSVWCRVIGRIPAGGQWPYFMRGASRGIPTTKLHSMYSRMLAAGAAVGAGHSNLQQPGQPCIIPQHGNMRKTFFYRCASVDTPNKLWPDRRADCNM